MTELRLNPHGLYGPCNYYCQDGGHVLSILVEPIAEVDIGAMAAILIASATPYYTSLGWQVVRARPHEGDSETALRSMYHPGGAGPVKINPWESRENPLASNVQDFIPWLLFVIKQGHDHEKKDITRGSPCVSRA